MSRFQVRETPLEGLRVLQRTRVQDHRGFLSRLFCADEIRLAGWMGSLVQVNQAFTIARGTVRGMHFQYSPHAEMKLVACLSGEVWDVAVDLRRGSPTFLRWHAEVLSPRNLQALLIPPGFAHGYQSLAPNCELIYFHNAVYRPDAEGAIRPTDSRIGIEWPLDISEISERDRSHPLLGTDFLGMEV
jgi:dTDP-4-dehydrorhamnose 3,5-epimerase